MNLNGGYAMIKHNATQEELAVAYKTKRPVLLYDADHRAHWAQINEKVIETVDEETQETITTYEYSYELLNAIEALVDDSGNPRFIEGDGVPKTIDGFTSTYCKWSLSGTHLMLVCAGSIEAATTIAGLTKFVDFNVPSWVMDKIVAIVGLVIDYKNIDAYATDYSSETFRVVLRKQDALTFTFNSEFTFTKARTFRIQFDLLIDAE